MNYNTEFKLQEFRKEQSQLFDKNGKRYSDTPISDRTAELMLQIIDELNDLEDTVCEKSTKRYWKCWKCGAVGFTEGELINNPPKAMCCAPMPVRKSGVCGGSFNIEINEQEYNEKICND